MSLTAIITFEISNTYEEWEPGFYAAQPTARKAGIYDLAHGYDPENPNKCMVVVQAPSVEALQEFFDKNVEAVAASGHIIESTLISFYNV